MNLLQRERHRSLARPILFGIVLLGLAAGAAQAQAIVTRKRLADETAIKKDAAKDPATTLGGVTTRVLRSGLLDKSGITSKPRPLVRNLPLRKDTGLPIHAKPVRIGGVEVEPKLLKNQLIVSKFKVRYDETAPSNITIDTTISCRSVAAGGPLVKGIYYVQRWEKDHWARCPVYAGWSPKTGSPPTTVPFDIALQPGQSLNLTLFPDRIINHPKGAYKATGFSLGVETTATGAWDSRAMMEKTK